MLTAHFIQSPFDESSVVPFACATGRTVREALIVAGLYDFLFEQPIVVRLNGDELCQADYERVLQEGDRLVLQVLPQAQALVYIYYIAVIAAVYYAYANMPDVPNSVDLKDPSPTYSINGKGNVARLGAPKPVFYGRMRTWPDLSAMPYTEFEADGDEVLYQLFEVRQGECVIDEADMRFEDTPLSSFGDYEVEVIQPGERPTIFPSLAVNSAEFNSVELIGGSTNSYVVCDIGQRVTRISVDFIAAGGLYEQNKSDGKIISRTVALQVECREIDDANEPIGSWSPRAFETLSGASRDAVRVTKSFAIAEGRYEVRVTRTGAPSDSSYVMDQVEWTALRGFLVDDLPLTTTTRIALKIRASEQLSNRGASKFNVISSGKIPVWNPATGWSDPVETANPAWVFADIARNSIYGGARSDAYIDLPGLYVASLDFDAANIKFNGGFDTQLTVWEGLTRVAAVGRGYPVDRAGVYYFVRDIQAPVPSYMFTHSNIVKDSFRIDYQGVLDETYDSVRVVYNDEDEDYRQSTLLCALPGSAAVAQQEVTLFGCTNKDDAYLWGMYLTAAQFYRRTRVEFDTGIEGFLPFYGDTISVSHYLVGRETAEQVSGDVVAFDGVDLLTLAEKVDSLTSPYIILRGLDGAPSSPYPVTVVSPKQVRILGEFDASVLVFDPGFERPHFMCGEGQDYYARIKIDKIQPQGNSIYRISGFVDAPEVYTAGGGLPTPPINVLPPQISIAPVIEKFEAFLTGAVGVPEVLLSWTAKNADYVILEYSLDAGSNWIAIEGGKHFGNSYTHSAPVGDINYRIAGVNLLRGEWVSIAFDTVDTEFALPPPVTNLQLVEAFVGPVLKVEWDSELQNHVIAFFAGAAEHFRDSVSGTSYDLSASVARAHGLGREFQVRVWSLSAGNRQSAAAATLDVSNPLPGQLNNLSVTQSVGTVFVNYDWPSALDIDGVSVWASTTEGFTPSSANLVIDRTQSLLCSLEMPEDANLYVRVGAVDVWGSDADYSGQFTLSPDDMLDKITDKIKEGHLFPDLRARIDLVDAPGGLTDRVDANQIAIANEIVARTNAIANEASAREEAIEAEAEARAEALLEEAADRQAAIANEANIRQSADDSFASQISTITSNVSANAAAISAEATARANGDTAEASARNTLATQMRGSYTGNDINALTTGLIYAERVARSNADSAMSSQIASLSAGNSNQFDHTDIWYFDSGVEGWTSNGGSPTITNAGWLRPAYHASDSQAISPAVTVEGTKYTQIRARIKKVGAPVWDGRALYTTTVYTAFNSARQVIISEPSYDGNGIALVTWNMDGGADWIGSSITKIRLDLSHASDASNYFEIDWVSIGRPAPGASSAEVYAEQLARVQGDDALASDIAALTADVAGKASASALTALDSRVTTTETTISGQSTQLTNLRTSMFNRAVNDNCSFIDWTGTYPAGWAMFVTSTGFSKHTGTYAYSGGAAMQFVTTAADLGASYTVAVAKSSNAQHVDIELVFTVTSGTSLSGAGILFDWLDSSSGYVRGVVSLKALYPDGTFPLNKKIVCNARLTKPAGAGAFNNYKIYLMADYAGDGLGVKTAKTIIVDYLSVTASDASASVLVAQEARLTAAESNISSQSSTVTSLSNELRSMQWTRDYTVNSVTIAPLLSHSGGALPTTVTGAGSRRSFLFTAVTLGTATVTQTIARFYHDGTVWQVEQISSLGVASNHPIFLVSSGVPSVTTVHTSSYVVRVMGEDALFGGSYAGNAKAISALDSRVDVTEASITSQSSAITALQSDVADKASTSALNALDTRVDVTESQITAQTSSINLIKASLTGGGNLLQNTDFESDISGWVFGNSGAGITLGTAGRNLVSTITGVNNIGFIATTTTSGTADIRTSTASSGKYYARVKTGAWYCASAYIAEENITAGLIFIVFYDAALATISSSSAALTSANIADISVTTLAAMTRISVTLQAPANAVYARIYLRVNLNSGVTAKFIAVQPMLEEVSSQQTGPSPYRAGTIGLQEQSNANASALTSLDARVTSAEGTVTTHTSQISSLTTSVSGKADVSALNALTTRVTTAEGTISTHTSQINSLTTTVSGKADASALTALDARVDVTETSITSQASQLNQLSSSVGGTGNLLQDTEFAGTDSIGTAGSNVTFVGQAIGYTEASFIAAMPNIPYWAAKFGATAANATCDLRTALGEFLVPVTPGKKYCASAWVAGAGLSNVSIFIVFTNEAGATTNSGSTSLTSYAAATAVTRAEMTRLGVFKVAASGDKFARVYVRGTVAVAGNTGRLKVSGLMISEVADAVTVVPPYTPGAASKMLAAVQQTANTSASTISGAQAEYGVKVEVVGGGKRVAAGFGLNVMAGPNGSESAFGVRADEFFVVNPSDGAERIPFIVVNGQVYISSAVIQDASIASAKIADLAANKITGMDSSFVLAKIGTGNITNAYIGSIIQSDNYVANSTGWRINKNGTAEFQGVKVRGDVEASAIKAGVVNIIDSLMIQDYAVAVPIYASATSTFGNSAITTWQKALTVSIQSTGKPIAIEWGFQSELLGTGMIEVGISTTDPAVTSPIFVESGLYDGTLKNNANGAYISGTFLDPAPPPNVGGTFTNYFLLVRMPSAGLGGYFVSSRFMSATYFKK
jgi:predicted phage tail protein